MILTQYLSNFIKASVVGTHLNCLDLSRQFKWVSTTYAYIGKQIPGLKSEDYEISRLCAYRVCAVIGSNAVYLCNPFKVPFFTDYFVPDLYSRPRWLSWMRGPTGDQEVAGSTPAEVDNILSWILIMKCFLRSFSPFRWFKEGSCQFLAKECAQYWLTA